LAKIKLKQGKIAESIILLDDIEVRGVADCGYADCGIFFQTRAEALLRLANNVAPERERSILIEAMKNIQYTIAAYDRCESQRQSLTRCILIAACLASRLSVNGLTNFYAVKYASLMSSMDGVVGNRLFPSDEDDSIPGSFIMNTGQPSLPSEVILSPRGLRPTFGLPPTSPKGRGMQTLIPWSRQF